MRRDYIPAPSMTVLYEEGEERVQPRLKNREKLHPEHSGSRRSDRSGHFCVHHVPQGRLGQVVLAPGSE